MKLKATITVEWEVSEEQLPNYKAKTIEEAAANQQKWFEESPESVIEMLNDEFAIKVEAIN